MWHDRSGHDGLGHVWVWQLVEWCDETWPGRSVPVRQLVVGSDMDRSV